MWDRFFQQLAYIGINRSRMRWYVRKNYLIWVKQRNPYLVCEKNVVPIHVYNYLNGLPKKKLDLDMWTSNIGVRRSD